MLINKSVLTEVQRNISALFNKWFRSTETTWEKIAMKVTSTGSENTYKWLSKFPKMKKWIDEKSIKALKAFTYTIVNDDWEATIEIDRNDIEDDNLGIVGPEAQMAGYSAAMLPEEIVYDLLNGAFENKCFDGQYFCDTDHPVGDGVVSNKLTVALDCSTLALAKASFGAAKTMMRGFKDNDGRPLKCKPVVLVVGSALEDMAKTLQTADRLEDGKPNIYKGTFELLVSDEILSPTAWFLLDTSKPVKPLIYQERKAPTFVSQVDLNSDDVFNRRKFKYGVEARAAGGYGFWQMCVGSTGAG